AFFRPPALRAPFWLAAAFVLYNAGITSAFAEPNYRYHFFMLPLLVVCAGFGAAMLAGAVAPLAQRRFATAPSDGSPEPAEGEPRDSVAAWAALTVLGLTGAVGWALFVRAYTT